MFLTRITKVFIAVIVKDLSLDPIISQNIRFSLNFHAGNGIIGGLYSKSDGCVDPTGLTNSFAKGAKMAGATVLEDCPVERIVRL